jgi:hypothetical protein
MSRVISFKPPHAIAAPTARCGTLVRLFADHRRHGDDVFWLKENAELLNILESTGQTVSAPDLEVHAVFYDGAADKLRFFPQYYRFLLSIVLDLEALGMPGQQGARMVAFADRAGLAAAELSDLQRAEARRLLARRGGASPDDPGLDDRLRAFASRNATFALPNKKAAYELTHIVFYLSEYGRRAPALPDAAIRSLHFAGLTAFLEQNADLLAEICIAMLWAGETPPALWSDWLEHQTARFDISPDASGGMADDYHEFLVCNWHAAVAGRPIFRKALRPEPTRFERAPRPAPLTEISRAMLSLDDGRCGEWGVMRRRMAPSLSPETCDLIETAAQSSPHFDAFFEGFARAGGA